MSHFRFTLRHMKRKVVGICLSLTLLQSPTPSLAADCQGAACIDVYTENGQLIIEGHKNTASAPAPVPKRARVRSSIKPAPRPKTVKPRISVAPKRVAPHPVAPPVKAESLNDRLVRLVPAGDIAFAPATNAVAHIPVIFWSNLPEIFQTEVGVIGEVIDVSLRPSFLWSFGDGQFFLTTSVGAPYPRKDITHIYEKPGEYTLTLVATWGGTWARNGVSRTITGQIRKVSTKTIRINSAQSIFTG